jgi:hypothetical protein
MIGRVEIRVVLDRVEPPAGCLRVVPSAGHAHRPGDDDEIRFTGWLGLLRALYEVTGAPAYRPGGDLAAAGRRAAVADDRE